MGLADKLSKLKLGAKKDKVKKEEREMVERAAHTPTLAQCHLCAPTPDLWGLAGAGRAAHPAAAVAGLILYPPTVCKGRSATRAHPPRPPPIEKQDSVAAPAPAPPATTAATPAGPSGAPPAASPAGAASTMDAATFALLNKAATPVR